MQSVFSFIKVLWLYNINNIGLKVKLDHATYVFPAVFSNKLHCLMPSLVSKVRNHFQNTAHA